MGLPARIGGRVEYVETVEVPYLDRPRSLVPMQQVNLPEVGTGWHTLQMTFIGNRILVYYDGSQKIDVTDNNLLPASYLSGGISADWWTGSLLYTIAVDNISVTTLPYGSSGLLSSSAFDGGVGVQWQTVSWDAAAGGSTNVCVRTRTADTADQLTTPPGQLAIVPAGQVSRALIAAGSSTSWS